MILTDKSTQTEIRKALHQYKPPMVAVFEDNNSKDLNGFSLGVLKQVTNADAWAWFDSQNQIIEFGQYGRHKKINDAVSVVLSKGIKVNIFPTAYQFWSFAMHQHKLFYLAFWEGLKWKNTNIVEVTKCFLEGREWRIFYKMEDGESSILMPLVWVEAFTSVNCISSLNLERDLVDRFVELGYLSSFGVWYLKDVDTNRRMSMELKRQQSAQDYLKMCDKFKK